MGPSFDVNNDLMILMTLKNVPMRSKMTTLPLVFGVSGSLTSGSNLYITLLTIKFILLVSLLYWGFSMRNNFTFSMTSLAEILLSAKSAVSSRLGSARKVLESNDYQVRITSKSVMRPIVC